MDDIVAVTIDKDEARSVLKGECLDRSHLIIPENAAKGDFFLLLKRDSLDDGQAIANAIVIALGILPQAMVIDADAPVPEGFAHRHFVEAGEPPHFRATRGQMVHEIIPPVTFCS